MNEIAQPTGALVAQAVSDTSLESNNRLLDEIFFRRDLDEVHLLIDFVSGRSDRTLKDLAVDTIDAEGAVVTLRGTEVIERITAIRYPPPTQTRHCQDAAFLLAAKDRLAAMAWPARGITIAFTDLYVTGIGGSWGWATGTARRALGRTARAALRLDPARDTLAAKAFPNLVGPACKLRAVVQFVMFPLIALSLVFALLTYWDVALGRSFLQRIDQADKDWNVVLQSNPSVDRRDCGASPRPPAICGTYDEIQARRDYARRDLVNFLNCDSGTCRWLHPIRGYLLFGPIHPRADTPLAEEQFATSLISVFNTYVLAMMFGLLGTMVGTFRLLQRGIQLSRLDPSDVYVVPISVLTGLVAGVVVGLYLSPTDSAATAGNISLSASGLGFLAGYGSNAFFRMLDGVLRNIFNPDSRVPAGPAHPQGSAAPTPEKA